MRIRNTGNCHVSDLLPVVLGVVCPLAVGARHAWRKLIAGM
jgi:hypothetical protein